MRDLAFQAEQWARRYEPHVEPLNRFVDELGELDDAGHPPYIPPMYRGVEAPALAILRDPGPKAGGVKGSGFLCVENDDQTAERFWHFLAEARIDQADVVPWNAYPWYINAKPTVVQLAAGVEPLRRIIELMPRLHVVLSLGTDARAAWRLFAAANGELVRARQLHVLETYHPSRKALQHPGQAERDQREERIRSTLRTAATQLGTTPPVDGTRLHPHQR
ncbi:MAG: uracil-DNA glycosylase, partial [Actinomycetota bacterium]|nr:uracil-DNA glycosylase [Actinomycetota bacterium]